MDEAGAGKTSWTLAVNREIGQTRAAYAATALEAAGVRVINSAAATDLCGDKWRSTVALRRADLPLPRTALALTPDAALEVIEYIGYPVVIKPLVGSWARLVTALYDRRAAAAVLEYIAALPSPQSHVVYVQEMIAGADHDIRAIVIGGEVIGAIRRRGQQWRSNVALGAVTERCPLTPELRDLAQTAAEAVGADVAGVDLIPDENGRLFVLEVNWVEFSGFQQAMGDQVDVAEKIADLVLARM